MLSVPCSDTRFKNKLLLSLEPFSNLASCSSSLCTVVSSAKSIVEGHVIVETRGNISATILYFPLMPNFRTKLTDKHNLSKSS